MTRTFEEMCAVRDPLYAATKPQGELSVMVNTDRNASECEGAKKQLMLFLFYGAAHDLAIRAMRNQHQPYYDRP